MKPAKLKKKKVLTNSYLKNKDILNHIEINKRFKTHLNFLKEKQKRIKKVNINLGQDYNDIKLIRERIDSIEIDLEKYNRFLIHEQRKLIGIRKTQIERRMYLKSRLKQNNQNIEKIQIHNTIIKKDKYFEDINPSLREIIGIRIPNNLIENKE